MANLLLKSNGGNDLVINLKLGVNRLGRAKACEIQLEHATISNRHCEIVLSEEGLAVRDCASTNGTFVDGKPVTEASLAAGQRLRVGDLELLVESTEVRIAIPEIEPPPPPAPPVVLPDGSMLCRRHPEARATHQCTHCHEILCEACVHRLRRRGGKLWEFCALCSHPCEPIGGHKKKKKSLLNFLQRTVKLPLAPGSKKGGT